MRLLVDQCLSPALAEGLRRAGHDAVHLRDRGLGGAPDTEVARCAEAENRVLLTRDTDFDLRPGTEVRHRVPAVVIRQGRDAGALNKVPEQLDGIARIAPDVRDRLERGAVVRLDRRGSEVVPFGPHPQDRPIALADASRRGSERRAAASDAHQRVLDDRQDRAELDRDDDEWGY